MDQETKQPIQKTSSTEDTNEWRHSSGLIQNPTEIKRLNESKQTCSTNAEYDTKANDMTKTGGSKQCL